MVSERKNKSQVVSFSEIAKTSFGTEGNLTDLVGVSFRIKDIEWVEREIRGEKMNIPIVTVEVNGEEKRYHTWSRVISKQLEQIEEHLRKGLMVEATIRKVKRYYTLA